MSRRDGPIKNEHKQWRHRGARRPDFADQPGPGQESVWDYPRPPAIMPDKRRVRVLAEGIVIADSTRALRILETASPPTFYLPPTDVNTSLLTSSTTITFCEWKGQARYFNLQLEYLTIRDVAWVYPEPFREFEAIASYIAFYPVRLECWLDDERVRPQTGGFYGGWVTSEIVGPFKGSRGTAGW